MKEVREVAPQMTGKAHQVEFTDLKDLRWFKEQQGQWGGNKWVEKDEWDKVIALGHRSQRAFVTPREDFGFYLGWNWKIQKSYLKLSDHMAHPIQWPFLTVDLLQDQNLFVSKRETPRGNDSARSDARVILSSQGLPKHQSS